MSAEEVKHLVTVQHEDAFDGRSSDIQFDLHQARIFTSNATSMHEWLRALPPGIMDMPPPERAGIDGSAKAIFKRTMFASVQTVLVGTAKRKQFWQANAEASARKLARVEGSELIR